MQPPDGYQRINIWPPWYRSRFAIEIWNWSIPWYLLNDGLEKVLTIQPRRIAIMNTALTLSTEGLAEVTVCQSPTVCVSDSFILAYIRNRMLKFLMLTPVCFNMHSWAHNRNGHGMPKLTNSTLRTHDHILLTSAQLSFMLKPAYTLAFGCLCIFLFRT